MNRIVSFIFSPFLIPTYIASLAVYANPYSFGTMKLGYFFIAQIAIWTLLIPTFGLLMMNKLELMPKNDERAMRLLPHFLILVTYSIGIYAINQLPINNMAKAVLIGPILAIVLSLFTNNFMRLTPHVTALSCLIGAFIGLTMISTTFIFPFLFLSIIITGVVASAQMKLNQHTLREIFYSFGIGFFSQVLSIGVFGLSAIL